MAVPGTVQQPFIVFSRAYDFSFVGYLIALSVLRVQCWMVRYLMNWKGFGRSQS
jgi:hypothetical protein